MPDFANRAEWEARLARELGRLQQRELARLIQALGDPPDLNKLDPTFWNEFSTSARAELLPTLEKIFLDSSQQLLNTTSIGVDWALINEQAAHFAESYSYDLVRGITDKTRSALQVKVPAYYRQGLSIGDLRDSLASLYGPVRSEMIAVTEVTRASVQGELATVKEIEKYGIKMVPVFVTNEDSIVCQICGPLNGKVVQPWQFPPRHPRCRCWVNHVFAEEAKAYFFFSSHGLFVPGFQRTREEWTHSLRLPSMTA